MKNSINQETCKKCKLCIEVCPCNIIDFSQDKEVFFIAEKEHICLKCGQCMADCSTEAIQIDGLSYKEDFFEKPENNINYPEFVDFLANRRSIRNFKDKPVEKEKIQQIIDSIAFSPNGSHPSKVEFTVVNNRKIIESALPKIADFLDDIVKWLGSPFMRFMIKRKKGIETFNTLKNHLVPIAKAGNYKLKYGDRITRNAPAIIIFHANKGAEEHTNNSMIYATYAMLAAHSLGLGATIIGLVPAAINKLPEVREIFKIPKENEAIISLIIGYPKYKYKKSIKRNKNKVKWLE